MMLWLTNLLAYSIQLAVLVGTGAVIMTALRVDAPRTTLRFWHGVFCIAVVWPLYQLFGRAEAVSPVFSAAGAWSPIASAPDIRATITALDSRVAGVVLAVLIVGALFRLAWVGVGLLKLRIICGESQPAESLSSLAQDLQRELGVSADIRFSDAVTSPATIGAQRPTVLLPRQVCVLPASVQRAVLVHELMHVQRRDWMATLLEEVWCAVLWFHPAARVLASRLSFARETLVDQATLALTRDRRAYAAALLEFSTARPLVAGATALIGRRHLERRIRLIAREVPMTRSALTLRLTVAVGLIAMATVVTTSAVPIAAAQQAQAEKVYRPSEDQSVTLPQVVSEAKPVYTAQALKARIQGTVWLTVVVLPSGDVGDVTVLKSLDTEHGLDDQAVEAARRWKFKPGAKDGKPVAVEVTVEMTFSLKK